MIVEQEGHGLIIYKCKNIFYFKMLKDIGMEVAKSVVNKEAKQG